MVAEGLPAQLACRVLDVSESGFHAWRTRPPSERAIRHAWLTDLIRQIHVDFRGTYGYPRVHAELTFGHGLAVGEEAVWLLMRKAGLQGLTGRPNYRRIPNQPTAGDLVDRDFARSDPDRLWVTDITEHPTREGKVYCAVVLDVFSRRVVGLVDRLVPERGARPQRARHGHRPTEPDRRDGDPLGPGNAVHLVGVHPPGDRLRAAAVDRLGRGLLR
jgi:transposase InsO family protein